jgi:hydroxypyruvate isomerase
LTRTSDHQRFFDGLAQSRDVALRLGAKMLIAQGGPELPGVSRASQHDALIEAMAGSADVLKGSGLRLGLEPLNTRVDHKGYYLSSTAEGLDIVNAVNRPEIGLTYDLYHSMVMDEVPQEVMAGHIDRIVHLHIADHPGRNQPGTGGFALAGAVRWLADNGYDGFAGLEYRPVGDSAASFEQTKKALA